MEAKYVIQDFKVTPGESCLYASLCDLMKYYGFSLSESDIFYICDGFHFEYESFENSLDPANGERLTSDNCEKWAKEFSDILSIRGIIGSEIDDERVLTGLVSALQNDNPILLLVDSKTLDYHPRHYQLNQIQDSHCIVLYGIDEGANQAYIGDSYIVDHTGKIIVYSGTFPLDRIIGSTRAFIWFSIQSKEPVDKKKILHRMVENLERFLVRKGAGSVLNGNLALYKCIDDIKAIKRKDGSEFEAACSELAYFISAHFLSKFDYVIRMLVEDRSFHIGQYESIIEDLKRLKSDWSSFCVHLLRAGFSMNIQRITRITDGGIGIVRTQERVFSEVLEHIRSVINNNG